ncbi:hypothetical protein [Amycolatopsis benzoatilytica]|nr:hypothetical protein [Amycolatopsis benzoatilytica]
MTSFAPAEIRIAIEAHAFPGIADHGGRGAVLFGLSTPAEERP